MWAIVLVVLLLLGGESSGSPKPEPEPPEPEPEPDAKCPAGSPVIYTGYGFNTYLTAYEVEEADLTLQERQVLSATLDALQSDNGFPAPAAGSCLQEDLAKYLGIDINGTAKWSSLAGMLAWHMFAMPGGKWLKWSEMTLQQKARASRFAAAASLREQEDEDSDDNLDDVVVKPEPTPGFWYHIVKNNTLLGVVGKAYGLGPGAKRLARAQEVCAAPENAGIIVPPESPYNKVHFPNGVISFNPRYPCGEGQLSVCYATMFFPNL